MACGITTFKNATAGDEVNWVLISIAALFILFSVLNAIWLFRKKVVIKDSEITIYLPFAFFKPIHFDCRYILGYGEMTETDDKVGKYKWLKILNENGKVHELYSYVVPDYGQIISFLKQHYIKNLGMDLFKEDLSKRRRFAKKAETVTTLGYLLLFFLMMLYFMYYTFFSF